MIGDCTGTTHQLWNVNADGTITNAHSGLCLDTKARKGTKLTLWTCDGTANQTWTLR